MNHKEKLTLGGLVVATLGGSVMAIMATHRADELLREQWRNTPFVVEQFAASQMFEDHNKYRFVVTTATGEIVERTYAKEYLRPLSPCNFKTIPPLPKQFYLPSIDSARQNNQRVILYRASIDSIRVRVIDTPYENMTTRCVTRTRRHIQVFLPLKSRIDPGSERYHYGRSSIEGSIQERR